MIANGSGWYEVGGGPVTCPTGFTLIGSPGTPTDMTGSNEWVNGFGNAVGEALTAGAASCDDFEDDAISATLKYRCCVK